MPLRLPVIRHLPVPGDLQTALRLRRRAGLPHPYEGETAFAEAAERTVVAEYGVRSTSAGALRISPHGFVWFVAVTRRRDPLS